jgi:prephenate dehydrogenase
MRATDMVRHDSPAVYEAIERANPHAASVRDRFFALMDEVRQDLEDRSAALPVSTSALSAAAY